MVIMKLVVVDSIVIRIANATLSVAIFAETKWFKFLILFGNLPVGSWYATGTAED